MPHYEFLLSHLQENIHEDLTLADYEEGGVICPRCGGHKVEQRWSVFSAITPRRAPEETRASSTAPKAGP